MSFWQFQPYRSVATKRADAMKTVAKLTKQGGCSPVVIDGTKISTSFWGKAWCQHIEGWRDYENRLGRGRSYVRHGAVVDLRLAAGEITAKVQGSSLYKISIDVTLLPATRWKAFKQLSLGKIGSLLSLMQGKLPDELLQQLTDSDTGLFPRSKEMKLRCNCPDGASLCKHLAAVLYGVGHRLDSQPELLFTLRGVDHAELLSQAAGAAADLGAADLGDAALAADDLSAIFGIELATPAGTPEHPGKIRKLQAKKVVKKTAAKVVKKAAAKVAKKTVLKVAKKAASKTAQKSAVKRVVKTARKAVAKKVSKPAGKAAAVPKRRAK